MNVREPNCGTMELWNRGTCECCILGIDASTQSLTAIVIEIEGGTRRVVFNQSLNYDRDFPEYGTTGGVLHGADGTVYAPPTMWADALDRMMARLATSAEVDVDSIRAISGSAQQHGSVYLNRHAPDIWRSLDPSAALAPQLLPSFSRSHAPVWLDASTSAQCVEIDAALGGAVRVAALTGSPATERFTGPQIRKFAQTQPAAYAETARIHLVSSYLASLLAGKDAPIDPGDGSGHEPHGSGGQPLVATTALDATAPDLAARLPPIQPPWEIFGKLSPYWQRRYSLPATAIVPWSGDNPSSLIGTGIIHDRVAAVSLGTSDTVFALTTKPAGQSSHVFRSPTGDFMSLVCFRNGSLAREWVRTEFGLDWDDVAALLEKRPGNDGRLMLPWLETETTPRVAHAGLRRFGFDPLDAEHNVRGLIEGQMMAIANHAVGRQRHDRSRHRHRRRGRQSRRPAGDGECLRRRRLSSRRRELSGARRRDPRLSRRSARGRRADLVADGGQRLHRSQPRAPRVAGSSTRPDVRRVEDELRGPRDTPQGPRARLLIVFSGCRRVGAET